MQHGKTGFRVTQTLAGRLLSVFLSSVSVHAHLLNIACSAFQQYMLCVCVCVCVCWCVCVCACVCVCVCVCVNIDRTILCMASLVLQRLIGSFTFNSFSISI